MNMAEMLLSMGGREWAKGGLHRIYLPVEVSARVLELKVTRYDSGNISSATLEGEKISNASAKEILWRTSSRVLTAWPGSCERGWLRRETTHMPGHESSVRKKE